MREPLAYALYATKSKRSIVGTANSFLLLQGRKNCLLFYSYMTSFRFEAGAPTYARIQQ